MRDLTPLVSVFSIAGMACMLLSIRGAHPQLWTTAGLLSIATAVILLARVLQLRTRPRHRSRVPSMPSRAL